MFAERVNSNERTDTNTRVALTKHSTMTHDFDIPHGMARYRQELYNVNNKFMDNQMHVEEISSQQKIKLQSRFPELDDEDFKFDYGMKEVMMTKLQTKLGKSRAELSVLLSELL